MKEMYRIWLLMLVLVLMLAPASMLFAKTSEQYGYVQSAGSPIQGSTVTLYHSSSTKGASQKILGSARTDENGYFQISYSKPKNDKKPLYLIAEGPSPVACLATVLGCNSYPCSVIINERTTVATAYAMAQFIVDKGIGGTSPGLQNASDTFRNLVNLKTANVGRVLGTSPNGLDTSSMQTFNSLANMLAGALSSQIVLQDLFAVATPPGGLPPQNTLQAAVNIAHNPWQNTSELFSISETNNTYQPSLDSEPTTWVLAIKYIGNGREFDGPGAMAFDKNGNVFVSNNYAYRKNHSKPTCAGRQLIKLTPTGEDAPGAPFDGRDAGLEGVGFGITLDPKGNVWLGNFGFYGSTCPENRRPPSDSVSKFTPDGKALSPRSGFTCGCIASPQGTVSDKLGNIWIANTCGGTVTRYRKGNPKDNWVFRTHTQKRLRNSCNCPQSTTSSPFAIAIDHNQNAWVSDVKEEVVFKLSSKGHLLYTTGPEANIKRPLGVAVDSLGNAWVSNSGIIVLPCPNQDETLDSSNLIPDLELASVTKLAPDGTWLGTFQGGGITIPWGIAVDGSNDIWVANFAGQVVTHLNGSTGQPIAPNGYQSDALVRNTGVSIDPSGNVWLCNNWLIDPVQTNPGGDGVVVFIGLAAPVKTPLFGPPEQP